MEPKLFHMQPAVDKGQMKTSKAEKKRTHIRKHVSLVMSKATCKENIKGLTFPDNLLALFGYRRVTA